MKLVTMEITEGGAARETIGVVLGLDNVLDLAAASLDIPPDMVLFLEKGKPGLDVARKLAVEAESGGLAACVHPSS
jgi:hypothetical protein